MDKITDVDKRKLALAIVSFILLIIMFSPLKEKIESIVGFREKELQLLGKIDLNWSQDIKIKPYEEEIIIADENFITSYSYDKVKLWKKNLKHNGDIYLSETGFFINNKNNNSITKLDLNGDELWNYEINYPAYTMTEIENYLLVYFKVDKNNRGITVIDQDGKLVLSKEKSKEEILSSNISENKKRVVITSMDNSTQDLNSKLTYLKYNGDTVWTEEVKDKIIYNVLFLDDNKLLLVGDKEIICKNDLGENLWKKEIDYDLKDIEVVDENKIYILHGTDNSTLEILNTDGELDYKKSFKKEYQDIDKLEENIFLIGKEGILGLRNKKTIMKYDIQGEVKDIKKIGSYIAISKDKSTEIFKIEDKKNK